MSSKPRSSVTREEALAYHAAAPAGKIALRSTKPCLTQRDLSLAYTPGVADPCLAIKADPEAVWQYTARGNLVAVVSDGTAVLGLGNIGPAAGLPVMEGKAILFKRFADIDAFPLCLDGVFTSEGRTDADLLIETVLRLAPTFGGINLEDIAAPACFRVEQELKRRMPIPVFHDDQHGTAIISLAGVINALKMVGKDLAQVRFVLNGAGAAGIACAEFYITAGARRENFILCDSKGVIHDARTDLTPEKALFAQHSAARSLADALVGADLFIGLSVANCVTAAMVRTMASQAIIFAMANPAPEILPDEALAGGAAVIGTGRSDFPNQVNNVLGFPGIFRGALDVRATDINEPMKLAAARALAEIAAEPPSRAVRQALAEAYPDDAAAGMFDGACPLKPSYVIPKPFDPRVVPRVARDVAAAAIASGIARLPIPDLAAYEQAVARRIAASR